MTNTLAYWEHSKVTKKRSIVNTDTGSVFTTLQFIGNLQIESNELECLSLESLFSIMSNDSLAYLVLS